MKNTSCQVSLLHEEIFFCCFRDTIARFMLKLAMRKFGRKRAPKIFLTENEEDENSQYR